MALINEAEFNVVSSIIYSLSSGKQDLIYFARDSNSSDTLSEVLVLPESKAKPASKTKPALTKKIACITADDALENLRKRWKRKKVRKRRKQLESRKERRRSKQNERKKKKSAITEKKKCKGRSGEQLERMKQQRTCLQKCKHPMIDLKSPILMLYVQSVV